MNWTHMIIHHSLTKDSATVSWGAIRNFHMTEMVPPMIDIGYHAGVELVGIAYEALVGRPWNDEGAHCKQNGMNRAALGFLLVGNFDREPPPDSMVEVLVKRLITPAREMFGIPARNIEPHRFHAPYKTCPGTAFTGELLARHVPGIDLAKWRPR